MLSAVMTWAREQDLPAVHLTVVKANRVAVGLYESFGFKVTGEYVDDRDGLVYCRMRSGE